MIIIIQKKTFVHIPISYACILKAILFIDFPNIMHLFPTPSSIADGSLLKPTLQVVPSPFTGSLLLPAHCPFEGGCLRAAAHCCIIEVRSAVGRAGGVWVRSCRMHYDPLWTGMILVERWERARLEGRMRGSGYCIDTPPKRLCWKTKDRQEAIVDQW